VLDCPADGEGPAGADDAVASSAEGLDCASGGGGAGGGASAIIEASASLKPSARPFESCALWPSLGAGGVEEGVIAEAVDIEL
jgi:hypothetical protein